VTDLDAQIVAASSLISVLLVFVFAYFSALLPTIEELRARARPTADDDRAALRRRLGTYQMIVAAVIVLIGLVVLLLLPLSVEVLRGQPWNGTFNTLRIGLLLVDVLLVATAAALVMEFVMMRRRRSELM
jgi:O-antigen/teichoic acid export membrane protein